MQTFFQDLTQLRLDKIERDSLLKTARVLIGQRYKLDLLAEDLKFKLLERDRALCLIGGPIERTSDPKNACNRQKMERRLEMLEYEASLLMQANKDCDEQGALVSKLNALTRLKDSLQARCQEIKVRVSESERPDVGSLTNMTAELSSEVRRLLNTNVKLHEELNSLKQKLSEVTSDTSTKSKACPLQVSCVEDFQLSASFAIGEVARSMDSAPSAILSTLHPTRTLTTQTTLPTLPTAKSFSCSKITNEAASLPQITIDLPERTSRKSKSSLYRPSYLRPAIKRKTTASKSIQINKVR